MFLYVLMVCYVVTESEFQLDLDLTLIFIGNPSLNVPQRSSFSSHFLAADLNLAERIVDIIHEPSVSKRIENLKPRNNERMQYFESPNFRLKNILPR